MTPDLLTADQLGTALGVSGATIRKWHRQGRIPAAVNEGAIIRFEEQPVRDALKQRATRDGVSRLESLTVPTF